MLHATRLLPVFLLAVASPAQDAPQQHLLRLAFQVGKQQYYLQSMRMDMQMEMGAAGKIETSMDLQLTMSTKVTAVKDGKADLEYTVHRLVAKASGQLQLDYDSDVEGADAGELAEIADIVGKTITLRMDERGNVSDFKLPEGIDAEAMDAFGVGGTNSMFGQGIPKLPDQPVAIGSTWQEQQDLGTQATPGAKAKVTHKLVEVANGKATIEQTFAVDLGDLVPQGNKPEFEKAGGKVVLDLATGMPIEMKSEMLMKMADFAGAGSKMSNRVENELKAIAPPAAKAKPAGDAVQKEGAGR